MATVITDRTYLPEDLLKLPEGSRFELIDGQLVESDMGALACWFASLIGAELTSFVKSRNLGLVLSSETQYRCFPDDPTRIRKADVSFLRLDRITPEIYYGFVKIAPDLVVEVVSEHDTYYEVEQKVQQYLTAKVRLVWVLNPATKSIRVYRLDGSVSQLTINDSLSGEDVLVGFSTPVAALFQLPEQS